MILVAKRKMYIYVSSKNTTLVTIKYSYLILGVYLIAEQHESRPVNIFTGKDERTFLFFSVETI